MLIRLYLDDETQAFREIENGARFVIDTTGIPDGVHRLRVETVEAGRVTGLREVPFSVRNGPGIAVAGLDAGDEVRGKVNLLVNASDAGIDGRFDVHAMETQRGIPFWMGGFALAVILACAVYLATDSQRHRSYDELAARVVALSGRGATLPPPVVVATAPAGGSGTAPTPTALDLIQGPLSDADFMPLTQIADLPADPVKGGVIFAAKCSGCHGAEGEGTTQVKVTLAKDGIYPRLAGQNRTYIVRQLVSFAEGWRDNAQMKPMALSLNDQARLDVAAYVETLNPRYPPRKPVTDEVLAVGKLIAQGGLTDAGVSRCSACHGADGRGGGANFPWLAGQNADYLANQMHNWRAGVRRNDWLQLMRPVAHGLDDDQITAVAAFFADIRPAASAASQ